MNRNQARPPWIVKLREYTTQEAFAILKNRAQSALVKNSWDDSIIKMIVEKTKGNITLGISILRNGALRAEQGSSRVIEESDVSPLLPKHPSEIDLNEHERVIFKILQEVRKVEHLHLYSLYCRSVHSPKQERTFRNYMQKLIARGLVRVIPTDRGRTYEVTNLE